MQLIKRNYNYKMLNGIIRNISKIDRNNLLPYKCKNDNFLNSNSFNLFMKFDINNQTFIFIKHLKIFFIILIMKFVNIIPY